MQPKRSVTSLLAFFSHCSLCISPQMNSLKNRKRDWGKDDQKHAFECPAGDTVYRTLVLHFWRPLLQPNSIWMCQINLSLLQCKSIIPYKNYEIKKVFLTSTQNFCFYPRQLVFFIISFLFTSSLQSGMLFAETVFSFIWHRSNEIYIKKKKRGLKLY